MPAGLDLKASRPASKQDLFVVDFRKKHAHFNIRKLYQMRKYLLSLPDLCLSKEVRRNLESLIKDPEALKAILAYTSLSGRVNLARLGQFTRELESMRVSKQQWEIPQGVLCNTGNYRPKDLADVLNSKYSTSFAAFKAFDLYGKEALNKADYIDACRRLSLMEYVAEFAVIARDGSIKLADMQAYLTGGTRVQAKPRILDLEPTPKYIAEGLFASNSVIERKQKLRLRRRLQSQQHGRRSESSMSA